jgi:hypothetical protein
MYQENLIFFFISVAVTEENMNVPLCMVRTGMCKVSQKNEQNALVITHQKSATIYLLF